jgi:anaerobic magnesium-protoporphyrin IX monomethyl ester cyclase
MKISFVFPPAWSTWSPSYAMALLAGACRRAGHEFHDFDLNIDMYRAVDAGRHHLWRDDAAASWNQQSFIDQLFSDHFDFLRVYASRVLATNPDVLAVSVQSASTLFGLKFAELVRRLAPRIFILFGGPDCFPSERGLSILDCNWVDALCAGEGDEVMPLYLDAISANRMRPVEMQGFCHKHTDGTVFDGGQPNAVMELDSLPFADFSGINFNRYTQNNRICIMTSRGCILRCAYCSEGANFLRYRYRSPESLLQEIERHVDILRKESKIRPHINFSDSLINGKPEALERFCHLILEHGIDFIWGGMALLRKEMTYDLLALMRKAGCIEIMWGMESGSLATLKLMRKKLFDPDLAERIIKDANSLGIEQYANIIVGFPGETEEQFNETARFLKRMNPYFKSFGLPLMEIRRNSHVYANPDLYGVCDKDKTIEWETKDGSNNINIRMARRQILSDILAEKLFDQGRYRKFTLVSSIIEQAKSQGALIEGQSSIEALTQLMKLYSERLDLRQAFGNIAGVNLTALVQWAMESRATTDSDNHKLAPYASGLASLAQQVSKTHVSIKLESQSEFLEAKPA